jgi:hypothetical protein
MPYDEDKTLARGGLDQDAESVTAPDTSEHQQFVDGTDEVRLNDDGDAGVEPAHVRNLGE